MNRESPVADMNEEQMDREITDEESFEALLAELIETAASNDVDIEGTREYREEIEGQDLEVMILALAEDDQLE